MQQHNRIFMIKKTGSTSAALFLFMKISLIFLCPPAHAGSELVTISSYTTSVEDQDINVKTNIAIAAAKLNGIQISPGEVFSFNNTVGEGSAKNGFLTGRVLYQDTIAYEPGGGICQLSSTLFNAMLLGGFNIRERHRHSSPVRYVLPGLDATIRFGKKDLRMKNVMSAPVYISTVLNDKSLTVILKSMQASQSRYEIYTEEEPVNLPFAQNETRNVRPGLSIYVYRKKMVNNIVTENMLLYKDFYPPVSIER